jgi:hypothetical protein
MRVLPQSLKARGKAKFPLATIPTDPNSLEIFDPKVAQKIRIWDKNVKN